MASNFFSEINWLFVQNLRSIKLRRREVYIKKKEKVKEEVSIQNRIKVYIPPEILLKKRTNTSINREIQERRRRNLRGSEIPERRRRNLRGSKNLNKDTEQLKL